MATFFKQVLDLQYTDAEILQEELNRLLGPGGWSGKLEISAGKFVVDVRQSLSKDQIDGINEKMRNHYAEKRGR